MAQSHGAAATGGFYRLDVCLSMLQVPYDGIRARYSEYAPCPLRVEFMVKTGGPGGGGGIMGVLKSGEGGFTKHTPGTAKTCNSNEPILFSLIF